MVTSEQILRWPMDGRIAATLALCAASAVISSVASCILALRHIRVGQRISGTLSPIRRSSLVAKLTLAVPFFALLALCALATVEAVAAWMLLLTLVLCRVIAEIPMLFLDVAGGPVRLQLAMKDYSEKGGDPVRLYGQAPLCCLRRCAPAKVPEPRDLPRLRLGIEQFVAVQPALAFLELFLQLEGLEGAGFVHILGGRRPFVAVLRVVSNLTAMSCMRGLGALVGAVSRRAREELHLQEKQRYGQSFLMGMHLLPTILHGVYTWLFASERLVSGYDLRGVEQARLSLCVVICLASLLCAKMAWSAFPVDMALYPELGSAPELAEPAALHTVRFCPFCGSHQLTVVAGSTDGECLACRACSRAGFPLRLEARSGKARERRRLPGL